jgi:hypothetical protein
VGFMLAVVVRGGSRQGNSFAWAALALPWKCKQNMQPYVLIHHHTRITPYNYIHPTRVLINPHQSGLTVLRVPVVIVLAHVSQAQHIAY